MYCGISLSMDASDGNATSGGFSAPRDFLFTGYCTFFETVGFKLIYLPNAAVDIESYFDDLPIRHLVLSGGNDLSEACLGVKSVDTRDPAPLRDSMEKTLLDLAVEREIPVFGICRAAQFINVYFGGTLTLNITKATGGEDFHVGNTHPVALRDPAAIELWGKDHMTVNSFHHQGILEDQLAPSLRVIATCVKDGIVEGLYHPDLPIAAVQWHPERPGSCHNEDARFAEAFLKRDLYWTKRRRVSA